MRLLGYGEDALTLSAVTAGLGQVLQQLGDPTPAKDAVVLYRPSFGRRSGTAERPRSEFGEFDAIVGTPEATYLVEAKWSASSELTEGVLTLRKEQLRRHKILRRYIDGWRRAGSVDWATFISSDDAREVLAVSGVSLPGPGTTLARNLEFVLKTVEACGPVRDVLLLSIPGIEDLRFDQAPDGFDPVQYRVDSAGGAGYLALSLG